LREIGYGKKIPELIKTVMDAGRCPNIINNMPKVIGKTEKKENIGSQVDGINSSFPKKKRVYEVKFIDPYIIYSIRYNKAAKPFIIIL